MSFPTSKKNEHFSTCLRATLGAAWFLFTQCLHSISSCFGACRCSTCAYTANAAISDISCSLPIFPKERQVSIFAIPLNHLLQLWLVKMYALVANLSTHHTKFTLRWSKMGMLNPPCKQVAPLPSGHNVCLLKSPSFWWPSNNFCLDELFYTWTHVTEAANPFKIARGLPYMMWPSTNFRSIKRAPRNPILRWVPAVNTHIQQTNAVLYWNPLILCVAGGQTCSKRHVCSNQQPLRWPTSRYRRYHRYLHWHLEFARKNLAFFKSMKNWMGPNPNGPLSCDRRAIRYAVLMVCSVGTVGLFLDSGVAQLLCLSGANGSIHRVIHLWKLLVEDADAPTPKFGGDL